MGGETGQADRRALLLSLFDAAVSAAHPEVCLPAHLPAPPRKGRLIVAGAGKAAAAMAAVAERHYRAMGVLDRVAGFTTAPHGTAEALPGERPRVLGIVSARHPTPDAAGVAAAERTLALVRTATADDLVLVLLSGGASALWPAPAAGLDLEAKTALTRGLLKSGADIYEMNTVRRHISRIKGGRLRKATPARMLTLAISDVPGDDPATIGSGPTVPDATTLEEARAVLARRGPRMRALGLRSTGRRDVDTGGCRQRDAQARRSRFCQCRVPHHRHACGLACRRCPRGPSLRLRGDRPGERRDGRGPRGGAGPCQAGA